MDRVRETSDQPSHPAARRPRNRAVWVARAAFHGPELDLLAALVVAGHPGGAQLLRPGEGVPAPRHHAEADQKQAEDHLAIHIRRPPGELGLKGNAQEQEQQGGGQEQEAQTARPAHITAVGLVGLRLGAGSAGLPGPLHGLRLCEQSLIPAPGPAPQHGGPAGEDKQADPDGLHQGRPVNTPAEEQHRPGDAQDQGQDAEDVAAEQEGPEGGALLLRHGWDWVWMGHRASSFPG